MKIVSWNVNGLRSVVRNDFLGWLEKETPDIVCLQEIKIQEHQIPFDLIYPFDYQGFFNSSTRKGYSGVAVYSKIPPRRINKKLGLTRFDAEGRMLEIEFNNFRLINLYIPHGSRDKRNLDYKLDVYELLLDHLKKKKDRNERTILVGDFNIAHKETDLARPMQNKNNIMFTKKEREQIDKILELGFIDSFRKFDNKGGNYTWFSYRKNARQKGLGWRIDYLFVSKDLSAKLISASISSNIQMGSDHCPAGIDISL